MRKLIKRLGKKGLRTDSPRRQGEDTEDAQNTNLAPRVVHPALAALAADGIRFGLKPWPSLPEGPISDNPCEVTVVAVHGLGGDFYRTWTTPKTPTVSWLSQLLPQELPRARIYSFGYESAPTFSRSVTGIRDSAEGLLGLMLPIVEKWPDQPIVFVCHSLGGIIVKQAIILAHEFDYYAAVLRATAIIVFMGTPHRGSQVAAALGPIAKLANFWLDVSFTSPFTGSMRTDLIHDLSEHSEKLEEMNESFKRRVNGITIISCFESEKPKGSPRLVVEKESAILGVPPEIHVQIQADHQSMCRFSSSQDPGYQLLSQHIVRALNGTALKDSQRSFTESERKYIAVFSRRSGFHVDEPLQGTCSWAISTSQYQKWRDERGSAVLWLTGDAGCGKTVLTNFLFQELRTISDSGSFYSTTDDLVCSFFCARDIELQKDAHALLKDLILQILTSKREVIKRVKARHSSAKQEYDPSLETIWRIFETIVETASYRCLYIVIDALDECEEKSRSWLLNKFHAMLMSGQQRDEISQKRVKLVISGQPLVSRPWRKPEAFLPQFYLDMEERPEGLVEDLQRFIDYKVTELVALSICSESFGGQLKAVLSAKAENSFLWLSVMFEYLQNGLHYRDSDIPKILAQLPKDLRDSYTKHLPPISDDQLPQFRRYLHLLVACAKPLTLSEVDIFMVLSDQNSVAPMSPVAEDQVSSSLRRALGPLVKFPDGTVRFIHSTAKEFFVWLPSEAQHPLCKTHGIDLEVANLAFAKVCMRQLLLESTAPDALDEVIRPSGIESLSPISDRSSSAPPNEDTSIFDLFDVEDVLFLKEELHISDDVLSEIQSRYPGYDYAALHWDYHFARAQNIADGSAIQDALTLLNCEPPRLARWYKYRFNTSPTAMPELSEVSAVVLAALFNLPMALRRLLADHELKEDGGNLRNALYWAASRGHLESVRVLLEQGASPYDSNRGRSALAVAIQGGFAETCNVLLDEGNADPNYSGPRAWPPLVLASAFNHTEILRKLLRRSNIVVEQVDEAGRTAFIQACHSGSLESAQELLRDGRPIIHAIDAEGRNALIHACMMGQTATVRFLLRQSRLDLHAQDIHMRNALSYAAERGHFPIVRYLVRANVPISQPDVAGRNAISWAANHWTAMKVDEDSGQCVLEYLVAECPNGVDSRDHDGWSPLAWAMDVPGYFEAVQILVGKGGADINQKDGSGTPIFLWAAGGGFTQIVEYLLSFPGLERNATDSSGRTALSRAAGAGRAPTVKILLNDDGVKVDLPDSKGRTARDWAQMNNHDDIVSVLSASGIGSVN